MRPGQLRHRISIQTNTPTTNDFNEEVEGWSTDATTWASIEPMSGKELVNAQQVVANITHKIIIRFRSGIAPQQRILFGSRIFNIESVINPEERNRELQLLCTEAV